MKILSTLFLLALFLVEKPCVFNPNFEENEAAELNEPAEQFFLQRSWPDRTFSIEAYRAAIQKQLENEAATDRSPCDPKIAFWKLQGPSNICGRVNTLVVSPQNENLILAGFGGSGIFKSSDAGLNWKPVFMKDFLYAIGDLVWHPTEPNTVFAGTGDPNISGYPSAGNGIYKSTDAGETWQPLGLAAQGIVAKIEVNPLNTNELWAACMGNPFLKDNNRGVYKSTDGGATWQQKLFISDQAGAVDLVLNPQNPQVAYACGWDRIRTNQESIIYGAGTKIFKTTDGGTTWQPLSNGLPTFQTGRMGLAISPTNPNKLFAVFIDTNHYFLGIWKTTDGGASWAEINSTGLDNAYSNFGWYFGQIRLNPSNDEEIWVLGVQMFKRGSGASAGFSQENNVHSDVHDLVFLPSGKKLVGCDGGVYTIANGAVTSTRLQNLPTTQFYRTAYNQNSPTTFYGGAQDNGTNKGSAAGLNAWSSFYGGDGFQMAFHPTNGQIFYASSQNGNIGGTSNGGNSWNSAGTALGTSDRTNWDTPFFISPHDAATLYSGTYRVYKSTCGPTFNWQPISNDLTDGNIFGDRFHTISCLDESSLEAGRLAVGTSDGNVWVKKPTGTWQNVTSNLPDRYVTSVKWSPTDVNTLFVSHSGYRAGEQIAHIHKSTDGGATWQPISQGIEAAVNDILIWNGPLGETIFAATDAGVWAKTTTDFKRLGQGIPTMPIYDLERNANQNLLIAATFARGIWTFPLDSLENDPIPQSILVKIRAAPSGNLAVPNVKINNDGSTDLTGNFTLSGLTPCKPTTVKPTKNNDFSNGVNAADVQRLALELLGKQPFTNPFQWIAADVWRNGQVTTLDYVHLRNLVLGNDTAFQNNQSWLFLPKNYVFLSQNDANEPFPESLDFLPNSTAPLEFLGIKIGDINQNVVPSNFQKIEERRTAPLFLKNRKFSAGEFFQVDIEATLAGFSSGQLTLKFDASKLSLERIEPLLPEMTADFFGKKRLDDGILTALFQSNELEGFEEKTASKLFRLTFRARSDGELSSDLKLENWPTPSRLFSSQGVENQLVISFSQPENRVGEWSVFPNPFGSAGAILQTDLPDGLLVDFQIFNAAGQLVFSEKQARLDDGWLVLPENRFEKSGVFYLKIEASGRSKTMRLVKI